ncbi:hypothetical protein GCM10025867_38660 [Frondihabitans sucicola]|uniref:Gfo/Idh/MocA-like oxidoreductase C-terminal domain-containing protein n=1 Tax=Frondihabitans sucicola TaxID=1268041 RepID=A0ABM8GT25_9MICO|nr:hypothetical protein GCM10025867_38660 [Frondihabitans sucicola]
MPNSARIDGTDGRIEIAPSFFEAGRFTVFDNDGRVIDQYESDEHGLRGMQHQAHELERVVSDGWGADAPLTPADTIAVASTMDEIRRLVGVTYPGESASS